jgi:hypothetical protein
MISNPEIQYTITRLKFFLEARCCIPPGFDKGLLHDDRVGAMPETFLVRKSLFDSIGGFNPEFAFMEDLDWFAHTKDNNIPMAIIDKVLLYKRVHDTNISYRKSRASGTNRDILRTLKQSINRKRNQKKPHD